MILLTEAGKEIGQFLQGAPRYFIQVRALVHLNFWRPPVLEYLARKIPILSHPLVGKEQRETVLQVRRAYVCSILVKVL